MRKKEWFCWLKKAVSENTEATLQPNRYAQSKKDEASTLEQAPSSKELKNDLNVDCESIIPKP